MHLYIIKHQFKMSHIKTLKSTPSADHHQGAYLFLVKITELNFEFSYVVMW
jgi:hypothetical protein